MEKIWRGMVLASLLVLLIPQMQAVQQSTEPEDTVIIPEQIELTRMDPLFYALIANGGNNAETDNLISFQKDSDLEIYIRLEGHFHVDKEHLRDAVRFVLYAADGTIMAETKHSEFELTKNFVIPADDPLGVYRILIDLGTPPTENLDCCAVYNYHLSYAGLNTPPHVQSLGDDFGFTPAFGYTSVRNDGGMYNFSFFATPGEYILYHQPWGINDVVLDLMLYDRANSEITLDENIVESKIRWYFALEEAGYYDFVVTFTDEQTNLGRIIGFKLTNDGNFAETNAKIVNLFAGRIDNTDSDLDMIPDWEEYNDLTTDPLRADTDGDGAEDRFEIEIGTDPISDASYPFSFNGEVLTSDNSHTFSVDIESFIDNIPFTDIAYSFDLNPNFVLLDGQNKYGEIGTWNFDSIVLDIETENNDELPVWFSFFMDLHFTALEGDNERGFAYHSPRIPPDRLYASQNNGGTGSSSPTLAVPVPISTLPIIVTLVIVPMLIRKYRK